MAFPENKSDSSVSQLLEQSDPNAREGHPPDPAAHDKRVRKILRIIEDQPQLSVRELAQTIRMSPAHLERSFKLATGSRVSDVLAERRLQKAATLLSASDMPIKQIAYAVGYEHHSSFVRAFQRRFAQSPGCYRNRGDCRLASATI
jgi:transcriptional regulator GlxA family with amidase domain